MELPKNITQIGEANRHCKIYVEDYVISYMKQLNQLAGDKDMAVALYGIRKEENDVSYHFLYGACKLTFLQKETRHLSQAQQQEIEKLRKKYFKEYQFLGYCLLNGEMLEGFHICEQGICRYIAGYAQFYEKNDLMLAYMLDEREDAPTEVVDREKYEMVRKRQEDRRAQHEEHRGSGDLRRGRRLQADTTETGMQQETGAVKGAQESNTVRRMRATAVAAFTLLCLCGLSAMNGDGSMEDLRGAARQAMSQVMEQKIPNAEGDTLVAEDKLTEAILQENEQALIPNAEGELVAAEDGETENEEAAEVVQEVSAQGTSESGQDAESAEDASNVPQTGVNDTESNVPEESKAEEAAVSQPVSYTIQEGDTLIGISVRNYGTDENVDTICTLNQIADPDDIKVGQTILLP